MKIINPLYDNAFKYLMQNNRIAKKVLSVLLDCEVLELTIEQQEVIAIDEVRSLRLYRLDFSAVIINEYGEEQRVLIELQKSKLPSNYLRFRTYLGESYTKKEVVTNEKGEEDTKIYPIISIYILGYNVVDIPYLAINIDNKITNTVTKEEIEVKSDFIDLLTHKTKVIQVRRLSENRRTRLEQFLMLFNQSWITSDKFILDLKEMPQDFDDIVKYLQQPVNDLAFRNKLKAEDEIDEIFGKQEAALMEAKQLAKLAIKEKQAAEKRLRLIQQK